MTEGRHRLRDPSRALGAAQLRDNRLGLWSGRRGTLEDRRRRLAADRAVDRTAGRRAWPGLWHQIWLWLGPESWPAAGTTIQVQQVLCTVGLLLQLPIVAVKLLQHPADPALTLTCLI